jgi:Spy/CpxP family protein refolding chaperone
MRSAHISHRQAEAAHEGFDADVSAAQERAELLFDLTSADGFEFADHAVQGVELELTADEQRAMFDFLHDFTDGRRAHRTRRRSGREALRSLPRLVTAPVVDDTAAA